MVIFSSNVLNSILSLVFLIVTGGFILIILEIEFLSFIIILLYIGAIAVLFLFVVMMLQLNKNTSKYLKMSFLSSDGVLYLLVGFKIFFFIFYLNQKLTDFVSLFSYQFYTAHYDTNYTFVNFLLVGGDSVLFLGLFSQKYYFFILVGIILLFAMVGSIVLCINKRDSD